MNLSANSSANAVYFLLYDTNSAQFELTKAAFESVLAQDIPVDIFIIDNGSTHPPTREWLDTAVIGDGRCRVFREKSNQSPVKIANEYLSYIFKHYLRVLCVPNDVVLPANLYREFLKCPRGVVTGSMTSDRHFPTVESSVATSENTPLAVVMWRRWVHDALVAKDGYFFDPSFRLYASDCDLALRLCACGIRGVQLNLSYWHFISASHKLSDVGDAFGADLDRAYFVRKWGFPVFDAQ